jgi:hypothetical protein
MNATDRLKIIIDYLNTKPYLKGLPVTVRIPDGQVRLEFKGISPEQIAKLRKDLDDRGQTHMQIINLDKKKHRKKKKRADNSSSLS